jgi:hypothetical protein
MKNIFDNQENAAVIDRINKLSAATPPIWGKMNAAQMLAHCNVTFELVFTDTHEKPGKLKKFLLKLFVKNIVVGEKNYSKNGRTAPQFVMADDKDFEKEKAALIGHITKTEELGGAHFHNKDSHSFGVLTEQEWNNMFYKHLDHHLNQFGV